MANSRVASQAGSYKLESFKIRPINPLNLTEFAKIGDGIELSQIITQWSFSESMSMANITGSVTVFDAEGVIRTLPIIGEEYITIQWIDFYGDKQTKKFFC